MIQFYFLSIVLNLLAGYILITGDENGVLEFKSDLSNRFAFKDETVKLVVGIIAVVVGLLKVLSVIEGDVPVLGDFIPALAGLLAGFTLIFEHYKDQASPAVFTDSERTEKIDSLLVNHKKIIGVIAMIAAVLHFLFPKVLLL